MEQVYALDKFSDSGEVENIVEDSEYSGFGLKVKNADGDADYLSVDVEITKFINIGVFDQAPKEWIDFVNTAMTKDEAINAAKKLSEELREIFKEEILYDIEADLQFNLDNAYVRYVQFNYEEEPGEDYRIEVEIFPYEDLFDPEYLVEERRLYRDN